MNEDDHPSDDDASAGENSGSGSRPESQEVRFSQVSALVPEHVGRGVFSTGAVVLQGPQEFIVDFLLRMTRPHQVAARVVMPPQVVARLIVALKENLKNYEQTFGGPPLQQKPPGATVVPNEAAGDRTPESGSAPAEPGPTTVSNQSTAAQDLYDQLKLRDEMLSGTYANAVMIGHTATEFSFDFITTFFPRSAVSCRVYLSAPNAPRFLDSLTHSFEQYQQQLRAKRQAEPPPESPPELG